MRRWLVLGVVTATAAFAHPQGFHERVAITVTRSGLTALLVMDVDGGDRCRLVRAGADQDRDGLLSKEELAALKAKLLSMAMKTLKLQVSGFPLELQAKESKLNAREDLRVSESALSIAALIEVKFPKDVTPGLSLEVEATSPDLSPVVIEVFQAGEEPPVRREAESGQRNRFRLGSLTEGPATQGPPGVAIPNKSL